MVHENNEYWVERCYGHAEFLDKEKPTPENQETYTHTPVVLSATKHPSANLIVSNVKASEDTVGYSHAPVIDIDVPCKLIPSSNHEHYHLFIEKKMNANDYGFILYALAKAGVVEMGYYKAWQAKGHTGVRIPGEGVKPGIKKTSADTIKEHAHTAYENHKLTAVVKEIANSKDFKVEKLSKFAQSVVATYKKN